MTLPGFKAEDSLYRTSGHYRTARAHDQMDTAVYPAYLDPNCYNICFNDCPNRCTDFRIDWNTCIAECRSGCHNECCQEEVTCSHDPAYPPDVSCDICFRDYCDGTPGYQWTTCDNPPPPPRLCTLNGFEIDCGIAQWCLESGACETIQ